MVGLTVLVLLCGYLTLWVWLVLRAYGWTRARGWSITNSSVVAALVFVTMYLIPFWDLIPTVFSHASHCESEAGFVLYKSVEQWHAENRLAIGALPPYGQSVWDLPSGLGIGVRINSRIHTVMKRRRVGRWPITRVARAVVDAQSGETLAEHIDFQRGYGEMMTAQDTRAMKLWLRADRCESQRARDGRDAYGNYITSWLKTGNIK